MTKPGTMTKTTTKIRLSRPSPRSIISKLLTTFATTTTTTTTSYAWALLVLLLLTTDNNSSNNNNGGNGSGSSSMMLLVDARYVTSATNELHHQQQQNERMAMPLFKFEAEDGVLVAASVASNHDGFSGDGFVDYGGEGSFTSWSVDIPISGDYDVTVRYASANTRPLQLLLDDNVVPDGQFLIPATSSWTNWQTETITVNLPAGNGQILKILAAKNPGPNVDFVTLLLVNSDDDGGIDAPGPMTTPPPSPVPTTGSSGGGGGDTLHVVLTTSQRMDRSSFTSSQNGVYEVGLDSSGDLVIRDVASSSVLWSLAAEEKRSINGYAMWMQNDGNLVRAHCTYIQKSDCGSDDLSSDGPCMPF
jgi:Carbohydrate binding module (family 6)